jgi:hypothetical protein
LAKRIQVPFEGKTVEAERLDFEAEKEPWSVYKLEDGTILRIRTVLGSAARLIDRYKPDGEPIYILGLGNMPILEIPPELRQEGAQPKAGVE